VSVYEEGIVGLQVIDLRAFAARFAKRTAAEALTNFKVFLQYKTNLVLDTPWRDIYDN